MTLFPAQPSRRRPALLRWSLAAAVALLAACASEPPPPTETTPTTADRSDLPPAIQRDASLWVPVRWSEVPGWGIDSLHEVWDTWVRSCARPAPELAATCAEMRPLSIASNAEQQEWIENRFQAYRIVEPDGTTPNGLLTGYYEPVLRAMRKPTFSHRIPIYAPPAELPTDGSPWYSRQEIDTLPAAKAALRNRVIAYLDDPIDALILHIQGSGRIDVTEDKDVVRQVRMSYAGNNGHPYVSVGKWLLDRGEIREASWESIRSWAAQNPDRLNDLLWANPRAVFFKEVPLNRATSHVGPVGAQGVPLTPGRSIAVDPRSIPYGTPVWIASKGVLYNQQKLVMAQDTGGAIVGAARADLFTGWGGWGDPAYQLASRLKQPVQMWAFWPR